MPRHKKYSIKKQCLILCEGLDEYNFLITCLNSEALADEEGFSQDIQVEDFGGIVDLAATLQSFKNMEDFNMLKSLMIIRDAEQNAHGAIKSIQSALYNSGFQYPASPAQWLHDSENDIRLGFLLFPELTAQPKNGALEDLCLQILAGTHAYEYMNDIDSFLDSVEDKHGAFTRKFKTRLHTYFSVSSKFTGLKVGESARAGAFDFAHPLLDPLKDFVRQMFNS